MMIHCQYYLRAKELLPENIDNLMFNSMARKDCISFVNYPDAFALTRTTCYTKSTSPANTGLAENFEVACSLADYFKNSIKRDASLFTILRKGNIGMIDTGTPSPLLEHRT